MTAVALSPSDGRRRTAAIQRVIAALSDSSDIIRVSRSKINTRPKNERDTASIYRGREETEFDQEGDLEISAPSFWTRAAAAAAVPPVARRSSIRKTRAAGF